MWYSELMANTTRPAPPRGTHRYDLAPMVPVAELNERDAAEYLGIPVRTLKTLRVRNQGPAFYKIGTGPKARVRYRHEDLTTWHRARVRRVESAASVVRTTKG
jgi:hypothetical protein